MSELETVVFPFRLPKTVRVLDVNGAILCNDELVKPGDIIRAGDTLKCVSADSVLHTEEVK